MTEHDREILEESNKTIGLLSELNDYFGEPVILKIYLQTQVIHKLFEENVDLDMNKLELFHIQFTTTLIDLLGKIRKRNERLVSMFENEIVINEEMVTKLRRVISEEGSFESEMLVQTQNVARSIYNFHKALSSQSTDYPFTDNVSSFSIKYYKDYFFEVDPSLLEVLTAYTSSGVYRNRYGLIGRDLLTDLAKNVYKISYFAGIRVGNMLMEIYRVANEESYFVFIPAKNYFLACDISVFPYEEWSVKSSKKERSIKELLLKNIELEGAIKKNVRLIDSDILELLEENYKKISEVDFLSDLENIDIQANTLKTMLETKLI